MPDAPMRLNGASFSRDKTGLVRLVVPWEVYSIADCDHFVPSENVGLPITDRNAEETEIGSWKLMLTYEGLVQAAQPSEVDSIEVEFKGNMAQDPIKSHPGFDKLKAIYGWEKIAGGQFPELLPGSASGGSAHGGGSASKGRLSEAFGTDSWLTAEGVFRATYTMRNAPQGLFDGVGTIIAVPRYWNLLGVPNPSNRNWFKCLPDVQRKGNAARITEEARLSGPKGWNKNIYGFSQLSRRSSGGGGGLSTGGLTTGSL